MLERFIPSIRKGIKLIEMRSYPQAIEHFSTLIKKNRYPAYSYFYLGVCYFRFGQYDKAKENLINVLRYKPNKYLIRKILEITNWYMLSSNKYFNSSPCFSSDGKKVAFISSRIDKNNDGIIDSRDAGAIYILDLFSGKEEMIVPDRYFNSHPMFSPDNKYLAYISIRKDESTIGSEQEITSGLYLFELNTGYERKLLSNDYRIKHFCFSPDSTKIYFSGWRCGEANSRIFMFELRTGRIEIITKGSSLAEYTFPSISPTGDKLVFSAWKNLSFNSGHPQTQENTGIYLKNLLDDSETTIAQDRFNNLFPIFSPDGQKVLYLSFRRDTNNDGYINGLDNAGIYLYDIFMQKEVQIVDDLSYNKFANFTPDGKNIIFISNRMHLKNGLGQRDSDKGFFENKGIYCVNIKSRRINQIVSERYYGSRCVVVSPMGDSIIYLSWRKDTNRGLYQAFLNKLPDLFELKKLIQNNI